MAGGSLPLCYATPHVVSEKRYVMVNCKITVLGQRQGQVRLHW